MHIDILIFAIIALFLGLKLKSVLGTKNGSEQKHNNPFSDNNNPRSEKVVELRPNTIDMKINHLEIDKKFIDKEFNKDGSIETGLEEIYNEYSEFNLGEFMEGSKYAFETIVTSFSKGERDELKYLLSPKLYEDFNNTITARELVGHTAEVKIHNIKDVKITDAHLGGTMAYITLVYIVEQTTFTKDKDGVVIEGNPNKISDIEDIWTFTRDIRLDDPNWILIETRVAEK